MSKRDFYDIYLKNQSKKQMKLLADGLTLFDGIIHDQHEGKYFKDKQKWRNPLLLRVSFPRSNRFKFIRATGIWVNRMSMVGVVPLIKNEIYIPLRGNHDIQFLKRFYSMSPKGKEYIKTFNRSGCFKVLKSPLVQEVLNGNLSLVV